MTSEKSPADLSGKDAIGVLCGIDPARDIPVDMSSLRMRVEEKMVKEGLEFTPLTNETVTGNGGDLPRVNNVIPLRRHQVARRNWLLGLSAAAAVATVGIIGVKAFLPETQMLNPGVSRPAASSSQLLQAAGLDTAIPGAGQRLAEVGKVEFVAPTSFSTSKAKAPGYRVSRGGKMSSGQVKKVAATLGLSGSVVKNPAGYTVKDRTGATLTVTVGELTSLSFDNPGAIQMECIPITPGDGNVELPNSQLKPSVTPTKPSVSPKPTKPEPIPTQIELPVPVPTNTQIPVPTETPTETVPPAIRPEISVNATTITSMSGIDATSNDQAGVVFEVGQLHAGHVFEPVPDETPAGKPSQETAQSQATQSPTPSPSACVMKVAGQAPSADKALSEVQKLASTFGAKVVGNQAGIVSKDGLTTVDVPVEMPDQSRAQNWRVVVSSNGVASVRANLGKETKIGDYTVISQAEAVERLNNPSFGPLDVYDPAGKTDTKIRGRISLVDAKLANAPVKQKDGSILLMPVYQMADDQGRIWTVLAVADVRK